VYLVTTDLSTLVLPRAYALTCPKIDVIKFNCRVASKWLFNEPVEEEEDPRVGGQWRIATLSRRGKCSPAAGPVEGSAEAIMQLKNSLGFQDVSLWLEQASTAESVQADVSYADLGKFIQCVDFGYTNEKFLDGISPNTPIELFVDTKTTYASGSLMMHSFTEMNYNLSIKQGHVTYTEPKPGVASVY
jgi:hypothetical protein